MVTEKRLFVRPPLLSPFSMIDVYFPPQSRERVISAIFP
jgi:hypothetical protein